MDITAALAHWKELATTPVPCVAWSLEEDAPGPWDSQIGGPGWGVPGQDVPRGSDGALLVFVAQVALRDLPAFMQSPAFPDGVIQIFADADMMACAFPSKGNGAGFLIRHIPAGSQTEALPVGADWDVFQWPDSARVARRMVPQGGQVLRSLEDVSLRTVMDAVYDAVRASGFAGHPWDHPDVSDVLESAYEAENPGLPLHTGGVPGFTQGDPRARDAGTVGHTFVLLNIGYGADFCVGDAGEWHILLRPEDWAAGKLDDALYNWDCH
jgi:uncharacterized protein YwqG